MEKKKPWWNVSFLFWNFSYLFLSTERYTEIERENRILLEKMSNIM